MMLFDQQKRSTCRKASWKHWKLELYCKKVDDDHADVQYVGLFCVETEQITLRASCARAVGCWLLAASISVFQRVSGHYLVT